MENVTEEVGRTVRFALESRGRTARLVVLVVAAAALAVIVVSTPDYA
jgi:hypothetical protein